MDNDYDDTQDGTQDDNISAEILLCFRCDFADSSHWTISEVTTKLQPLHVGFAMGSLYLTISFRT